MSVLIISASTVLGLVPHGAVQRTGQMIPAGPHGANADPNSRIIRGYAVENEGELYAGPVRGGDDRHDFCCTDKSGWHYHVNAMIENPKLHRFSLCTREGWQEYENCPEGTELVHWEQCWTDCTPVFPEWQVDTHCTFACHCWEDFRRAEADQALEFIPDAMAPKTTEDLERIVRRLA